MNCKTCKYKTPGEIPGEGESGRYEETVRLDDYCGGYRRRKERYANRRNRMRKLFKRARFS